MTEKATIDTGLYGAVRFALRDGLARVVYVVCEKAVLKYFPDSGALELMKSLDYPTEVGHMIGYNAISQPRLLAGLLLPGLGKIWHRGTDRIWTAYGAGTLPNVQFTHAVAANAQRWMIWRAELDTTTAYETSSGTLYLAGGTDSPIWETADGGATWTELLLGTTEDLPRVMSFWAEYDHNTSGKRHIVLARRSTVPFPSPPAVVYLHRGTTSSLSELMVLDAEANQSVGGMAVGIDGDTVLAITRSNDNDGIVYVRSDDSVVNNTADDGLFFQNGVDILVQAPAPTLSGRTFVTYDRTISPTLRAAADYHVNFLTQRSTAGGGQPYAWMAASRAAIWISNEQDLLRIADVLGGAASEVAVTISGSGDYLTHVRADHQARRYVAARILNTINGASGKDILLYDTETGESERVTGPAAPATTELANWVEVIATEA